MSQSLRDDFRPKTKNYLALRANYRCSICDAVTSGPSDESQDKAINTGVAAHICAASPGGPRYNPDMTIEERVHIANGIWLCANHSIEIDRDVRRYTPDNLRHIKATHESRVKEQQTSGFRRTYADDLIAFGLDVVCVGELIGSIGNEWKLRVDHFVIGDMKALIEYGEDFARTDPYDRFVLSNSLGDGRQLLQPLSWTKTPTSFEVTCTVAARFPRKDARQLPRTLATNELNDIFVQNGDLATVSGIDALPDKIKQNLSAIRGESSFYPNFGTRLKEYFDNFDDSPWLARLIKLETIRMACIPYQDAVLKEAYTPLQCVLQVHHVERLSTERTKDWLQFRFDLELDGVGRWSREIPIFIPTGERPDQPWLQSQS